MEAKEATKAAAPAAEEAAAPAGEEAEAAEGNGEEVDLATGHMVTCKGEAEIDEKNNNTSLIGLTVIAGIVFTFIAVASK